MESRPTTAFILTLLGGLFSILGTIIGLIWVPYSYILPGFFGPFLLASGIAGGLVLVAAFFLYTKPDLHVAWGVVTIVFSVVAAAGFVTGYFILFGGPGVVLGLIGGSFAITWKSTGWAQAPGLGAVRMCSGCGRYIPVAYPYCAFCGTPAPTFRPPGAAGTQMPDMPPPR